MHITTFAFGWNDSFDTQKQNSFVERLIFAFCLLVGIGMWPQPVQAQVQSLLWPLVTVVFLQIGKIRGQGQLFSAEASLVIFAVKIIHPDPFISPLFLSCGTNTLTFFPFVFG